MHWCWLLASVSQKKKGGGGGAGKAVVCINIREQPFTRGLFYCTALLIVNGVDHIIERIHTKSACYFSTYNEELYIATHYIELFPNPQYTRT